MGGKFSHKLCFPPMPLTNIVAKNAKSTEKKYKLSDENGLFLLMALSQTHSPNPL